MKNSYSANKLKKEGKEVMVGGMICDLIIKCSTYESLEVTDHFKKFLLQIDQMLDDDMILEIKEAIAEILP